MEGLLKKDPHIVRRALKKMVLLERDPRPVTRYSDSWSDGASSSSVKVIELIGRHTERDDLSASEEAMQRWERFLTTGE